MLWSQTRADVPPDTTFHAVSYVESAASAATTAASALERYRDANRTLDGVVRVEVFEQIGRPGHFSVIETWRDQKAFDARDPAVQKQLLGALHTIRVSDYDQRPYKTLTVGPATGTGDRGGRLQAARQAVYVIAHVDVTPNPQVPVMLARLAEASRKEPGNLRFDVMQHMMRANHFTVVEAWRNQQAFDAHVEAAHTKQYRDALQPMTGSPLDERVYKAVD